METQIEKVDGRAASYGKSLALFVMFPIGYWALKIYSLRLQETPGWLLMWRMFFGMTSFILAFLVASRTSDPSLSDRERRMFRAICFFAITPPLGLLLFQMKG